MDLQSKLFEIIHYFLVSLSTGSTTSSTPYYPLIFRQTHSNPTLKPKSKWYRLLLLSQPPLARLPLVSLVRDCSILRIRRSLLIFIRDSLRHLLRSSPENGSRVQKAIEARIKKTGASSEGGGRGTHIKATTSPESCS